MEKTEEKQNPNEQMEIDGFPEYEEEYESVQDINSRMMDARGDWNPPEKPSFEEESESDDVYHTGVIRSIKEDDAPGEDYAEIKLGLDTGEDQLEWVSLKDTGERNLSNPYIRFCDMYDANPDTVQELYGEEIYVKNRWNNPVVKPSQPIIKTLWNIQHMQYKLGFYKYKEKTMNFEGLVPRFRHLGFHGALFMALSYLSASTPLLLPIMLIVGTIFIWGLYAKARYDIVPYTGKVASHYWEIYKHKKA